MRSVRLNQILNSIADAGRELLRAAAPSQKLQAKRIDALCDELLSTRGEASGTALAREVAQTYLAVDHDQKNQFFHALKNKFDVDAEAIGRCAGSYRKDRDLKSLVALAAAVEAPRQELFRRINMAPDGTATLVSMRQDLLSLLPDFPELEAVDVDLHHLLVSWFNPGFLSLERIDWHTSAVVLEKLIQYETVHQMDGWDDLRRRLADDRRCFAFIHPALPDEPVIFVEVALSRGMADAIQPLIDKRGAPLEVAQANTAIFYSINNCHVGLTGISFGNFLIKQVVLELAMELPSLKTFATLSPIPDFRVWLAERLAAPDEGDLSPDDREIAMRLARDGWARDAQTANVMKPTLLRLCARYLLHEKRRGKPIDPVARFHLRNGARLERINWLGDTSPKGLAESAGMLVNYLYDPKEIERNHEDYVKQGRVAASIDVMKLTK
jgi:malonyl-CoA decarboxylase